MSRVILVILSNIINEAPDNDEIDVKKELQSINYKCKDITIGLSLQFYERLDHCNLILSKRVTQLEGISDEYHLHIGESTTKVNWLERDLIDDATIKANAIDGRKKIFHKRQAILDDQELCKESISINGFQSFSGNSSCNNFSFTKSECNLL